MRISIFVAVVSWSLGCSAAASSSEDDNPGNVPGAFPGKHPGSGTQPPPSMPTLTVLPLVDAASLVPSMVQALANVPEVTVSTVTSAWFAFGAHVSECIAMDMDAVLAEGDELNVTWSDSTELSDGVYAQQITIEGGYPGYVKDGYAHPAHDGLVAYDARFFRVANGVFDLLTNEEYRATDEYMERFPSDSPDSAPTTSAETTLTDCAPPDAPAAVEILRAAGDAP